ncbi:N-acetyltransferase [Azospirillum humicireducens]|uniref:N-acetyltransferase n=1 Tax=Azospirillum humicireducens TaxID=1226968 RepID=A0A160JEN3_9PROT|nr:N-acetyltransferase [Azospirillum humicireducens]ANC91278.1 N-acetyltransferase [Azospirillum humicireducens]
MRHEIDPVHCDAAFIVIRRARAADIPALLAIEEQSFATDRMTWRNFRYAILKAKGVVLVAERQEGDRPKNWPENWQGDSSAGCPSGAGNRPVAYGVLGFHAGTPFARLTSFAVEPASRSRGIARRLLSALEDAAAAHGCAGLRLEVRADNMAAIALYSAAGYRRFAVYPAYYEDDMTALRLEKPLTARFPATS